MQCSVSIRGGCLLFSYEYSNHSNVLSVVQLFTLLPWLLSCVYFALGFRWCDRKSAANSRFTYHWPDQFCLVLPLV